MEITTSEGYFVSKEEIIDEINENEEVFAPPPTEFQQPNDPFNPPPISTVDERFNIHRLALLGSERKRNRTESLCSNKSTAIARDLQKIRRPEEKPSGRLIPNRAAILKKEKSMLTMKDMIYYNPLTNPMSKPKRLDVDIKTEIKVERSKSPTPEPAVVLTKSHIPIVPQLKLGPNGEMILDEQSLVVESSADRAAKQAIESSEIVYDDGNNAKYGYFKRQKRTKDWPSEETIRFYRCLHTVGTDFSLMLSLFPNRTRRDLKIKFKKEEKNNSHLIDKALLHPKEFDIDALRREFDEEDAEKAAQVEVQVETKAKYKKTCKTQRSEEIRKLKNAGPQRHVSRVARTLTEVSAIYDAIDNPLKCTKISKRRRAKSIVEDVVEEPENENDEDTETEESPVNTANEFVVENPTARFTVRVMTDEIDKDKVSIGEKETAPSEKNRTEREKSPNIEIFDPADYAGNEGQTINVDSDDIDLNRLVVCETLDVNGATVFQVHLSDPVTGELSKDPLDLPPEIIETLIENLK